MKELNMLGWVALVAVIVGGLDLGLLGIFNINIISSIFGSLGRILYILIGVGAGYLAYLMYLEKFKK